MIDEILLYRFGAEVKLYKKDVLVYEEGAVPYYYYQIQSGSVKLNNYKEDGKEFIQNIFSKGQSFGESLLFLDYTYPTNAIALEETKVLLLSKFKFLELLDNHPQVLRALNKSMAERLYFKCTMLLNLSNLDPNVRMLNLLDYFKSLQKDQKKYSFKVPYTRQQIADFTGLCVETVIRASKKLAKNKIIKIQKRKIYY